MKIISLLNISWKKLKDIFSTLFRRKSGKIRPPKNNPSINSSKKPQNEPPEHKIPTINPGKESKTINTPVYGSISVVDSFPPVVQNALLEIDEIQKGSIRYILGHLGVDYVPQLAIDIVRELRQDAVCCLFKFLDRIKIDPDLLLIQHSIIEKHKLEEAVGILLEADEIRRDYNVSPMPIYEALQESLVKADHLLSKMGQVANVLKTLQSGGAGLFYDYRKWFQDVRDHLEHWEHYRPDEIDEVLKYGNQWDVWQHQYDNFIGQINTVVKELSKPTLWPTCKEEVQKKLELVSEIESRLLNDPIDETIERPSIEKALSYIEVIFKELEDLFSKATGHPFITQDSLEAKLRKARKVLGVETDVTLGEIKKIFRKLAIKFHPDKNPGNQEAEKKFIEIKDAYELLKKEISVKEPLHV